MIEITKFKPEHFSIIKLQEAQHELLGYMDTTALCITGKSYTMWDDDKIIGCAGVMPKWRDSAVAWATLSQDAYKHLTRITRLVRAYLDIVQRHYARIETVVRTDFPQGHRWVIMLGFEREGTMKNYSPQGIDFDMYARTR